MELAIPVPAEQDARQTEVDRGAVVIDRWALSGVGGNRQREHMQQCSGLWSQAEVVAHEQDRWSIRRSGAVQERKARVWPFKF